jgi:hypothetical protein
MKRIALIFISALTLLICAANPSFGQIKPQGGNPFVIWEYDWVMGLQLHEIQNCDFSSDESLMVVLSSDPGIDQRIGYITFIETKTGRIIDSIHIVGTYILDIKFYNDSTVIVGYNDKLRFYNIHTKQIVKEIDYIKKFKNRIIQQFTLTNDKKYLAVCTIHEFVVINLETDSIIMERALPDCDINQDPLICYYYSCRFINKKNTLLVVNNSTLLEYDFKRDTLINTYDLSVIPAYWNLDVSDSEDMVTYAEAGNNTPYTYILNLKTNNIEKIATGETDNYCTWSNFLFKDKFLQLTVSQIDKNKKRLFSIFENKLFDVELPRLTPHNLRSKINNKFIIYGQSRIAYIDGDYFLTDVNNVEKPLETLLHPNPGTIDVKIDINLNESGLYSLKIANNSGNIAKQQNYGFLESGINHLTVQISDLIPGVYFLTLTNGKVTYNFKLVKE